MFFEYRRQDAATRATFNAVSATMTIESVSAPQCEEDHHQKLL